MRLAVLAWFLCLLASGLLEAYCAYTSYDLRASARSACTRLKPAAGGEDACFDPPPGCFAAATISSLSPRALSDFAGYGGPLLTWLPLLLGTEQRSTPPSATSNILMRAMVCTWLWYLALIGLVRHTHLLVGSRWDPSGHVFVYGSQLVPLWHLRWRRVRWRQAALVWLVLWECVLCYLSVMTAVAFHTLSETLAASLLVLVLVRFLDADGHRSGAIDQGHRCPVSLIGSAAGSWVVATLLGWVWSAPTPLLGGYLAYDATIWMMLGVLLRLQQVDDESTRTIVSHTTSSTATAESS
jgi:hypothetical protein